ncbi:hypothetical protein E6W36_08955 [Hankyongella ginsenosidimutans]|uniref:Cadherin domain-containing protein n=1 Tax=Hankyongella ginsenosidimutans TaxID=1763828 RepID=A0A4D7CC34_9SPHN|nr:hypothetical protein E6W36_08955 [Hankyongella ginsenosidimutans]
MGARDNDVGGGNAGAAYVVYGRNGGRSDLDLTNLTAADGFRIIGDLAGDRAGVSVSNAGDVNGDGIADLIVGATGNDAGGTDAGAAYVVYGERSALVGAPPVITSNGGGDAASISVVENTFAVTTVTATDADAGTVLTYSIAGGADAARFTINATTGALAFAQAPDFETPGDLDDNNIYEVIVRASDGSLFDDQALNVTVLDRLGNEDSDIDLTFLDATQGFRILGGEAGPSVSNAGDVNGDGIDDLIVGAPSNDAGGTSAGAAYVVYGRSGGLNDINLNALTAADGFRILGDAAFDYAGSSVSNAGDVNGDGLDDLIVGAFFKDTGDTDSGAAYVVYGRSGGLSNLDLTTLTAADGYRIIGVERSDYAGKSVSGAGDVNGDGIDDLIIGAPKEFYLGGNRGSAYVIYGRSGGRSTLDLGNLSTTDGFRFTDSYAYDPLGNSVSSAGDVNGDGIDDLIVGAPSNDAGGINAGAAYVIYGRSGGLSDLDLTALTAADGFRIIGDAAGNRAGYSVSNAGDVNADGIDDLIVGAFGNTSAGAAYVIFGRSGGRSNIDLSNLSSADGFRIIGRAGISVSNAGDVNDDGLADLIVGSSSRGLCDLRDQYCAGHHLERRWRERRDQRRRECDRCHHGGDQ